MYLNAVCWYALVFLTANQFRFSKCVVDNGLSDKEETLAGHSVLDTLPRLVEPKYHHSL